LLVADTKPINQNCNLKVSIHRTERPNCRFDQRNAWANCGESGHPTNVRTLLRYELTR
jgi:hypothetical protein